MHLLPDPTTLLLKILLWLGCPAIVVTVISVVSSAWAWVSLGRTLTTRGAATYRDAREAFRRRTRRTTGRLVTVGALGTLVIAWSYSISQLLQLMLEQGGPAFGGAYSTVDVLSRVLDYTRVNTVSGWVLLLAVSTVACALWAAATENPRYLLPTVAWIPVGWACLGLTAMAAIGGCAVLVLGATGTGPYTVDMVGLYVTWIVLLLGWWALSRRIRRVARAV